MNFTLDGGLFNGNNWVIKDPKESVEKFNQNHDPRNGQFTSGSSAGGGLSGDDKATLKDKILHDPHGVKAYCESIGLDMQSKEYGKVYREALTESKNKVSEKPYTEDKTDYRMYHRPSEDGPGYDITKLGSLPNDFYDHPEKYCNMRENTCQESFAALKRIHGDPEAKVAIYRAAPKGEFNDGDWITLSREYAKLHAETQNGQRNYSPDSADYLKVHKKIVKAKDIQFAGDDINEFGYFPNSAKKSFSSIEKYNKNHDPRNGQFTTGSSVKISSYSTGAYSGQVDMRMSAKVGDKEVGYIQYSDYDGEASVQLIHVEEDHRRQGVATKLMQQLQSEYDGKEISFGYTTEDGTKLLERISYEVKDQSVIDNQIKLKAAQRELSDLEGKIDSIWNKSGGNPSDKDLETIESYGDRWDELHDKEIPALESALDGKKAVRTFIKKSVDIEKYNHNHDPKTGRFTSGEGGSSSSWSKHISEEKERVLSMDEAERAQYVWEHGGGTQEYCLGAMASGRTQDLVDDYFAIMEKNGDPTPKSPTSGQLNTELENDVRSGTYSDYDEARLHYIANMTGQDLETAGGTLEELEIWFSNRWDRANTSVLDNYINSDHVYNGTMYRGMRFDKEEYAQFMENISPGATISMKRNSSWSSDKEVAYDFAYHPYAFVNSVVIECVSNRTSSPVSHLSTKGEEEVLASSKAKWTVLSIDEDQNDNGTYKTTITVVERGA